LHISQWPIYPKTTIIVEAVSTAVLIQAFAVEFDRGEFDRHKLEIVLYIDGNKVDSRLQCPKDEDADTRTRFECIETDSGTKEFRFSDITADMVGESILPHP
jgi:hypothetical protein